MITHDPLWAWSFHKIHLILISLFPFKLPFFFLFLSPSCNSIFLCVFHVKLCFKTENVTQNVLRNTGSTCYLSMKGHFRHTLVNSLVTKLSKQHSIIVKMAFNFAKIRSCFRRFPSLEMLQL